VASGNSLRPWTGPGPVLDECFSKKGLIISLSMASEKRVTLSRRGSASPRHVIFNNLPFFKGPEVTALPPTISLRLPSTAWENYCPLHFFDCLHGNSNQKLRRSRRAALGAIRTWTPYLRICAHGQHSTMLRIGFQTLRTPLCGHLLHRCSP
jgi:hypothetical protein